MKKPRPLLSKIKSAEALAKTIKSTNKRTVFTNGCFDLIHKGHVSYLQKARSLGDILIVALNSDASVKRIKGPSRPLNSLKDRLEVMAALESVDYVTWFSEDTPLKVIRLLGPKVLVKGGDWKIEQIVGAQDVIARGGKVFSLPYVKGRSTTRLLHKARAT
ncbi:MAG: ADP-heptose synthase [Bdellovibrionales bacterium RIFOXYD1_FULL_44_7]|nr:MAG: ADP-heptose synthase [Bdellovibrionales bacterium RIFOXYD1_FULL_44_7]